MKYKPVWLIESRQHKSEPWYPCWYEVYYSKKESVEALKKLRNGNCGFHYGYFRTTRYERAEK